MSLARKLILKTSALVLGLIVLAVLSLSGLSSLNSRFLAAEDQYNQLRSVYQIANDAAGVRILMQMPDSDQTLIVNRLNAALQVAGNLTQVDPVTGSSLTSEQILSVRAIIDHLATARDSASSAAGLKQTDHHLVALNKIATLADALKKSIIENRTAATDQLRMTIVSIAIAAGVLILIAILIGVSQYRSVMKPLGALERGVTRIAAAEFAEELPSLGDREFQQLARQFNIMAKQLQTLYQDLEGQVQAKSQQLIQSQRLVSVGYLAAGVAHEINNPLAIIGGYAESALKSDDKDSNLSPQTRKALNIICEEAFRCKQITTKLLQLSRPDLPGSSSESSPRKVIEFSDVLKQVVSMLRDLPAFASRSIHLDIRPNIHIQANEAEMTQVLINLFTNAIEATSAEGGEVHISLSHSGSDAMLVVRDNGLGISASALPNIFEPFYTDKPKRDQKGTGLGLAITHAIVEQHGGSIAAHSSGENQGSTFTIKLPLAQEDAAAHAS